MIVRRPQKLKREWEVYLPINRKQTFMASFKEKRHAELYDMMWDDVRVKSRYKPKLTREQLGIAKRNDIHPVTAYRRVNNGWDVQKAITEKTDKKYCGHLKIKKEKELKEIQNADYDKVLNYLLKKFYFRMNKESIYKKFPHVEKETIDVAWKKAQEVLT